MWKKAQNQLIIFTKRKQQKKTATKQYQCRVNAHYSPSLVSGPTARELKNVVKMSPGGQN